LLAGFETLLLYDKTLEIMKILGAQQLKWLDQETIKNEPIPSIDLMERAAFHCYHWISNRDIEDKKIHIFCGMGNNGGDGLAIARFLVLDGYNVNTYVVHFSETMSEDFVINYKRAEEVDSFPVSIHSSDDFPEISSKDIVIDAVFGIGLNKAPSGFTKELIQHINNVKATVYAIDVPSGLFIDRPVIDSESVIKAVKTLTFQTPKLAFLLPDNQDYVQSFKLLDIGLDSKALDTVLSDYHFTTAKAIQSIYKKRTKFSHKGSFGHAMLIGGSFGKIGAVVLAAKAALKIGSGLVTAYIPKCGYTIMQTSIPEVMVEVDAENIIEFINYKSKPSVIGLGVGIGVSEKTTKALGDFLSHNKLPLVLDADSLNIISKNINYLELLPEDTILTPHPKELERLIGPWKDDYDKIEKIKVFSTKHKCIILLKGAHSLIVKNDQCYFNSTGNPALATAGSGDVLTGIVTGLLAQKYTALEAVIMGVFLHGKSADYAVLLSQNSETFIASDIFNYLADAYSSIFDDENNDIENQEEFDENMDDFLDNYFFDDSDPPF